jgi:hypothetical protein
MLVSRGVHYGVLVFYERGLCDFTYVIGGDLHLLRIRISCCIANHNRFSAQSQKLFTLMSLNIHRTDLEKPFKQKVVDVNKINILCYHTHFFYDEPFL